MMRFYGPPEGSPSNKKGTAQNVQPPNPNPQLVCPGKMMLGYAGVEGVLAFQYFQHFHPGFAVPQVEKVHPGRIIRQVELRSLGIFPKSPGGHPGAVGAEDFHLYLLAEVLKQLQDYPICSRVGIEQGYLRIIIEDGLAYLGEKGFSVLALYLYTVKVAPAFR